MDCNCFWGLPSTFVWLFSCGEARSIHLPCPPATAFATSQHTQEGQPHLLSTYQVSDTLVTVNRQGQIFYAHLIDQEAEAQRGEIIYSGENELSQF